MIGLAQIALITAQEANLTQVACLTAWDIVIAKLQTQIVLVPCGGWNCSRLWYLWVAI